MAGPAYYTAVLNIARNDDWIVPFVYASISADGTQVPIDLTGSVLTMDFRALDTDHEVLLRVTTTDGSITINDAVNGEFTILITVEALQLLLAPGDYVSDLVRLMPNGLQERLLDCAVTVVEGVTR